MTLGCIRGSSFSLCSLSSSVPTLEVKNTYAISTPVASRKEGAKQVEEWGRRQHIKPTCCENTQMLQGLLLHQQQRTASTCPSPLRQHKWKPNSQALKVICLSSPPLLPLPATFCLPLASYYFLVNKVVSVSLKSIELMVRPGRIIHRDLLALQFCIIYYKCLWAEGSCLDFTQGMIVCLLVRLFLCLFSFSPPFFSFSLFLSFPFFLCFWSQLSSKYRRFAVESTLVVVDHTLFPCFHDLLRISPVARGCSEETSGFHSLWKRNQFMKIEHIRLLGTHLKVFPLPRLVPKHHS